MSHKTSNLTLIPHKDDEKYLEKFQTENKTLIKELGQELEKMQNEAKLYADIRDTQKNNTEKLTKFYVELREGQIDVKQVYGDLVGKPIDSDRFRHSYPQTAKNLEKAIENHYKQENTKDYEQTKGNVI